ncbi:DinB family protein [Ignavibacterium sp.]|uniref:DinB family protein n=1 Tax=Ignavibacterium sp. TaxID=2651167 RepID=UPI0021F9DCA6|nr:DinB family protein [Ignavibacterium sp.]BDQ03602.1 MAG: diguanylate cyclase [Ignavibacterium sp.]
MKQFFIELFDYNHQCNLKLCEAFVENQDKVSEKAIKIFNHLLNAHQIWNSRILQKEISTSVWEIRPLYDLEEIEINNHNQSLEILNSKTLDEKIHYSNTKGQKFSNNILDILFHIINHSTYHRGQIASDFRQNGLEPIVTDFIVYKRQ